MLQAGDYFYDAPERFHNSVGIWENSEGRPHAYALREAVGKSQNCRVCWLLVTVATFNRDCPHPTHIPTPLPLQHTSPIFSCHSTISLLMLVCAKDGLY